MEQANTGSAPVGGIGDVTSTAKGSGARYNTGKPPLELIPLRLLADYYSGLGGFAHGARSSQEDAAILCLRALGRFQERGTREDLLDALLVLGNHWDACAHVFDYGRRKYAEFNWAKGMKWSVPLGCAARHLEKIILGQEDDDESGYSHAGHVYCNVVMLYTFTSTFEEGDDRPPVGYLYPSGGLPSLQWKEASHEDLTFASLTDKLNGPNGAYVAGDAVVHPVIGGSTGVTCRTCRYAEDDYSNSLLVCQSCSGPGLYDKWEAA